jgi:hypothetical protein
MNAGMWQFQAWSHEAGRSGAPALDRTGGLFELQDRQRPTESDVLAGHHHQLEQFSF